MTIVLQLSRKLESRPAVPDVPQVELRHYTGPPDVELWLDLRRRAFAKQRVGVGDWNAADFAREFLEKPWWQPQAMWFAETPAGMLRPASPVGTITLARRGEAPHDKPVVHWLAVLPRHRRSGVGRLLMAVAEQAAWDAGHRQVWLETHSGWTAAVKFYKALGYEPVAD